MSNETYVKLLNAWRNLLARIDRDGGHAQTGIIEDDLARADKKVVAMLAAWDASHCTACEHATLFALDDETRLCGDCTAEYMNERRVAAAAAQKRFVAK